MIEVNGQLPDIEKLERHEFTMDVEERQKLIANGEDTIKVVRICIRSLSQYCDFIVYYGPGTLTSDDDGDGGDDDGW